MKTNDERGICAEAGVPGKDQKRVELVWHAIVTDEEELCWLQFESFEAQRSVFIGVQADKFFRGGDGYFTAIDSKMESPELNNGRFHGQNPHRNIGVGFRQMDSRSPWPRRCSRLWLSRHKGRNQEQRWEDARDIHG